MLFEIHITGESGIHFACKNLGIKTIVIDLIKPVKSKYGPEIYYNSLQREHMTSFTFSGEKEDVFKETLRVVGEISKYDNARISRIKIESMFFSTLINESLYMETHFYSDEFKLPTSINMTKRMAGEEVEPSKYLATDRTYNKSRYFEFMDKYSNNDIELCIFDSFVDGDKSWFDFYSKELFDAKL